MDLMFYAVPGLIMAAALGLAYRVVYRSLQVRGAWNSGLTAEARCLRAFTTVSGGRGDTSVRTTMHHVYEFTTGDGRLVRFEEEDGPATVVEGDHITVHYAEGRRGVVATARRPAPARLAAGTLGILAFLAVVLIFCVGFMVTFARMSAV